MSFIIDHKNHVWENYLLSVCIKYKADRANWYFVKGSVWEIWEHPIDTAQLETATAASVSCIRAHISEIGEIDAPGTWGAV